MDEISHLESQCRALGQRRRLRILAVLKRHRRAFATDIVEHIHCTRPAASQHLRILREAGVITHRRRGQRVLYVLSPRMSNVARTVLKALS